MGKGLHLREMLQHLKNGRCQSQKKDFLTVKITCTTGDRYEWHLVKDWWIDTDMNAIGVEFEESNKTRTVYIPRELIKQISEIKD